MLQEVVSDQQGLQGRPEIATASRNCFVDGNLIKVLPLVSFVYYRHQALLRASFYGR